MQIAIVGAGSVGGALGSAWARAGHSIIYGVTDPANPKYRQAAAAAGGARLRSVSESARLADTVVLAVPFDAVDSALGALGDLSGHTLIDVTNPLRMGKSGLELALGFDRSGGEYVAGRARGAAVFKTLNQVGFGVMADASGYAAPPVMFVAGDNDSLKPKVMGLVSDLGFQALDAGPLAVSRLLEPFAMLWIHMVLNRKAPGDNAFAFLARQQPAGESRR